jgi:hypothetical protein
MRDSKSNPESAKLVEAKAFLAEVLRDGPVEAAEVALLAKTSGISEATVRRAKSVLCVRSERVGGSWLWALPEGQDAQGTHPGNQEDHQDAHQGAHRVTQAERDAQGTQERRTSKPNTRLDEPRMFVYSEADGVMISHEELRRRKGYLVEERP